MHSDDGRPGGDLDGTASGWVSDAPVEVPLGEWPIHSQGDVVLLRRAVRGHCRDLGMGLVDETKVVTAASELGRNALEHGGGGKMIAARLQRGTKQGLRLTFEDQGPGIPDVEMALRDGYSTRGGLGLGLGGARRLMDDFAVETQVGRGTRVVVTRWR